MLRRKKRTAARFGAVAIGSFCALVSASEAKAKGWERVRFVVVDVKTRQPIPDATVIVEDMSGLHTTNILSTGRFFTESTPVFDLLRWRSAAPPVPSDLFTTSEGRATVITLPAGTSVTLRAQNPGSTSGQGQEPPVKDIYIKVTATRRQVRTAETNVATKRDKTEINTFTNTTKPDTKALTQGQSGVASDSNGQQHIRGEHAAISYVVDGVPLPDTLSGRQGAIIVPSTIDSLEILTGGYAPEFGGQTAAILNVVTVPGAKKADSDLTVQGGSYDTLNGAFNAVGPLGTHGSYVLSVGASRTRNAVEPQQPDDQTAHNTGSDQNYFTKLRFLPGRRDTVTLSVSRAAGTLQLNNRTGLPDSFRTLGQGFGFLGQRNADGTRPDATGDNAGLLGASPLLLGSAQADGQDITQREVSEFATLSWRRQLSARDTGLLSVTFLHSGQDLHNQNPAVDVLNLPVDNSIEYNPTVIRNVHHVQITGSLTARRGKHQFKTGILLDDQSGDEAYRLVPGSQLALNALAALAPGLAPSGTVQTDESGQPVKDINGNPVYVANAGTSPVLQVHRSGFYRAAYVQDTWQPARGFTMNYGVRGDWYKQSQNLGQDTIDTIHVSPRVNLSVALDRRTAFRTSYNRLFNTPPLAQGAIIGHAIQPERLDQYDVSVERQVAPNQTVKLAYYVKQIRNQVDTGLLIPGSQIGLYSSVSLQYGAVHGLEFSYDILPVKGVGWDIYLNYTYSSARPNGKDNTGADVPAYNDHDQRQTVGLGFAYLWKGGASAALTLNHGSGLASSPITTDGKRVPLTQVDFRISSGPRVFGGHGGVGLDVVNLFDDRTVINYQSAFSGTRFQQGRRVLFTLSGKF